MEAQRQEYFARNRQTDIKSFASADYLPDDYYFDLDKYSITEKEVRELYVAGGWVDYADEYNYGGLDDDIRVQCLAPVGVRRRNDGLLVGFGFLDDAAYPNFELSGLMVRPDHRGKKIGEAIIKKRVEIADYFGANCGVEDLDPTNTLIHKYLALGFVATGKLPYRYYRTAL